MREIKSEKAKELIQKRILDKRFNDGLDHACIRAKTAILAISIAEQEAEERHENELQELRDKCAANIKLFTKKWDHSDQKMDNLHHKELQELKDKAIEAHRQCCKYKEDWFCSDLDNRTESGECDLNCQYIELFTQKLNEK